MSHEFPPPAFNNKQPASELETARGLFVDSLQETTRLNAWLKQYQDTILKMVEQDNSTQAIELLERKKNISKNEGSSETFIKELENLIESIRYYSDEKKKAPQDIDIQADSNVLPAPMTEVKAEVQNRDTETQKVEENKKRTHIERPRLRRVDIGEYIESEEESNSENLPDKPEDFSDTEKKSLEAEIKEEFRQNTDHTVLGKYDYDKLASSYKIEKKLTQTLEEKPKTLTTLTKTPMRKLEENLNPKSLDALKNLKASMEKEEKVPQKKVEKSTATTKEENLEEQQKQRGEKILEEMKALGADEQLIAKANSVNIHAKEEMLESLTRKVKREKTLPQTQQVETFEQKKNKENPINPEVKAILDRLLTPEMISQIKEIFAKEGLKAVVHGGDHTFYNKDPKTGKPIKSEILRKTFAPKADEDGKISSYLLGLTNIDVVGTSFVEKGAEKRKVIPDDNNNAELGNEREWKTGEGDIYLDTGGTTELIVVRDGKVFFNNHQPQKDPHTSSAEILNYVLEKTGMYTPEVSNAVWKDNLIHSISAIDNMEIEKQDLSYIEKEWPYTLRAITSELMSADFNAYIELYKNGITDTEILNPDILDTRLKNGKTIRDLVVRKKEQVQIAKTNIDRAQKRMKKFNLSEDHPLLGKIILDDRDGVSATGIELREVAHAQGIDTVITLHPELKDVSGDIVSHGGLFISSPGKDVTPLLEKIKALVPTAQVVRGSMILAFPENETVSKERFYEILGIIETKADSNESQGSNPEFKNDSVETLLESLSSQELDLARKINSHQGTKEELKTIVAKYREIKEHKKHIESGNKEEFTFSIKTYVQNIIERMRPELEKKYEEEREWMKRNRESWEKQENKVNGTKQKPDDLLNNIENNIKTANKENALKQEIKQAETQFRETTAKQEKAKETKEKLQKEIEDLKKQKTSKSWFGNLFSNIPRVLKQKERELQISKEKFDGYTQDANDLASQIGKMEAELKIYTDKS